jgi:hypothetical protein
MTHKWVPYEKGSAVQKAVAMVNGLKAQGVDIIPMHQGAEETMPGGKLAEFREFSVKICGPYNPAKGPGPLSETFGNFAETFLGIPGKHAFAVAANGRVGLGFANYLANNPYNKNGVKPMQAAPDFRWPMVDNKAEENYAGIVDYKMQRGKMDQNIKAAIEGMSNPNTLASVYTNVPWNPGGLNGSKQEIRATLDYMDGINGDRSRKGLPPLVFIADDPYFAGLPQKPDDEISILDSAYAGNFTLNSPTPSIHVVSLSKALGLASPGIHGIIFTNSDMAEEFAEFITANNGPSFVPEVAQAVNAMLNPDLYPDLAEHFKGLHDKYARNGQPFKIPGRFTLMDGDDGMTRVVEIPPECLNKTIKCIDDETREIKTPRQALEYAANTYGLGSVDQSAHGRNLVRLALKAENPDVAPRGADALQRTFEDLGNAQSLKTEDPETKQRTPDVSGGAFPTLSMP